MKTPISDRSNKKILLWFSPEVGVLICSLLAVILLGRVLQPQPVQDSYSRCGKMSLVDYQVSIEPLNSQLYSQRTTNTTPPFIVTIYKESDAVSEHVQVLGIWEAGLSHVVTSIFASKRGVHTIVDFGTHVGWFSLLAASKGHFSIGIEAMGSNRQALISSIAANRGFDQRIFLHAAALGSDASPKELCIRPRTTNNLGNGIVSDVDNDDSCSESVPVKKLDDIVGNQDIIFMKADCEGCEGSAFFGAKRLFENIPPCSLFIEWHPGTLRVVSKVDPKEIVELLLQSGYMFFRLDGHLVTGAGLFLEELKDNLVEFLCENAVDMVLLNGAERCFPRDSKDFLEVLEKVNVAGRNHPDTPIPL